MLPSVINWLSTVLGRPHSWLPNGAAGVVEILQDDSLGDVYYEGFAFANVEIVGQNQPPSVNVGGSE